MTADGKEKSVVETHRKKSPAWLTDRVGVEDTSPDSLAVKSIDRFALARLLSDEPELGEFAFFRREPLARGRPVRHEEPAECADAH